MSEQIKMYKSGNVIINVERDIIKFLSDNGFIEFRNEEQTPMGIKPPAFIITKPFSINVEVE